MKKLSTVVMILAMVLLLGVSMAFAGPVGPAGISGKVVDTMESGGYTYAQVEKDGQSVWVAIPKAKVTKDTVMSFQPGMAMKNFTSKSMKRTFDVIYFSSGVAQ